MTSLPHDKPRWQSGDDRDANHRKALDTLLRFHEQSRAYRSAAEQALAATNLLRDAGYPGADDLRDALIPICGGAEHLGDQGRSGPAREVS